MFYRKHDIFGTQQKGLIVFGDFLFPVSLLFLFHNPTPLLVPFWVTHTQLQVLLLPQTQIPQIQPNPQVPIPQILLNPQPLTRLEQTQPSQPLVTLQIQPLRQILVSQIAVPQITLSQQPLIQQIQHSQAQI